MIWGCQEGVLQTGWTFAHLADREGQKIQRHREVQEALEALGASAPGVTAR